MSDDTEFSGGTDPYESVGIVAASQSAPRQRAHRPRFGGGGNPYEHGAKSPERAWDGAGLDTRDCDNKASWLESRLARKTGWSGPTGARSRSK